MARAVFAEKIPRPNVNDLLPVHWWNYCAALAECRSGVLASRSLEEKGLQLGDTVTLKWNGNDAIELTILAFVSLYISFSR